MLDDSLVILQHLRESRPADQMELAIHAIAMNTLSDRRATPEDIADTLSFQEIAELLKIIRRVPKFAQRFLYLTITVGSIGIEQRRSMKGWTEYLLRLVGAWDDARQS